MIVNFMSYIMVMHLYKTQIVNKIINDHNGTIKFKPLSDGAKININFLK